MNEATKQAGLSVLRSVLIAGGTIYATKHNIAGEVVQEVVGVVMTLIPIAWGIADKYIAERKAKAREVQASLGTI